MTYQPREDSILLNQHLETLDLEGKRVLDMGTGSGILAATAAESGAEVVAADIDPEALEDAKDYIAEEEFSGAVDLVESDLFENVMGKFDLIVFNPPYLQGESYEALEGGEEGVELTEKFLELASEYLAEDGYVLFISSSRADLDKLREGFELEQVEERKLWFETLYLFKSD